MTIQTFPKTVAGQTAAFAVADPKNVAFDGTQFVVKTGADLDLAPPAPSTCTRRQFFRAMDAQGLTAAVATVIAAAPSAMQIDFNQASEFDRNDPGFRAMAAALGKSDADVDVFMILANSL